MLEEPEALEDNAADATNPDERLELIFTCWHPALAIDPKVGRTLKALGDLSTEEITRAFHRLVRDDEATSVAAEPRSKRRVSRFASRPTTCSDCLAAVLAVVYLIFNEGYGGQADMAGQAMRLGRVLVSLMPDEREVPLGRSHAAPGLAPAGPFRGRGSRLLADQNRSLWDAAQISAARVTLDRAIGLMGRGSYVLLAAVASLQSDDEIDWNEVAALNDEPFRLTDSPVVRLNGAVALAGTGSRRRRCLWSTSSTSTGTATSIRPEPSYSAASAIRARPGGL